MAFSADGFQESIGFVSTGNDFIETVREVIRAAGDDTHDAAVGQDSRKDRMRSFSDFQFAPENPGSYSVFWPLAPTRHVSESTAN